MRFRTLALATLTASLATACAVDPKYSSARTAADDGFPELALELGRVDPEDCVLEADQWEPVFIRNNITTGKRVSNALNGMQRNKQIIYFQEKRVIAVAADFCDQ